jgi:hypothetical protein
VESKLQYHLRDSLHQNTKMAKMQRQHPIRQFVNAVGKWLNQLAA